MNTLGSARDIALLYSGGLDTSVILKWLTLQGHNVTCYTADIGQQDLADVAAVEKKALNCGAARVVIENLQERFVSDHIIPCMRFQAIYGGGYHMCCSMARPLISQGAIEAMKGLSNVVFSHGATGKGNDQVRFELAAMALRPDVEIFAPWKDEAFRKEFPGRQEMLAFAAKHNIPVTASIQEPYSNDGNMAGETYEAGDLEKLWITLPEGMFKLTNNSWEAPDQVQHLTISFENGIPVAIDGKSLSPVEIIHELNKIGGLHGIGRNAMVEDRRVGMKSRGVYEEPALHILWQAHQALESLVLDKDYLRFKKSLADQFADEVYDGNWFCPKMQTLQMIGAQHQQYVTGRIRLDLYRGNMMVTGWESPHSLYSEEMASMDQDDQAVYNQSDAKGYTQISSVAIRAQSAQGRVLTHG